MKKWLIRILKGFVWFIVGSIGLVALIVLISYLTAHRPDEAKMAEVERLTKIGRSSVPELLKFLHDKDGALRYEVIYRLNTFHDLRIIKPMIKELKISDDEVPRKWAAQALGNLRDTSAVIPLIEALSDKSFHVRYKSADALGKIGDARALNPLKKIVENENEMDYVRIYAENAIIDICEKSQIEMPKLNKKEVSFWQKIKSLFN